jgi:predicted N-acetyltransferase YhbS
MEEIRVRHIVEPELHSDHDGVEQLLDLAFGLSRRTKTSYRFREGSRVAAGLSFVVRDAGVVTGHLK